MVCDLAYQQLVGEHKDTPLLRYDSMTAAFVIFYLLFGTI